MADEDAIQRKHKLLAAETYEYFWNVCPELTARWKQAMLTLRPAVRDLAVEMQQLEAVTNAANQQLSAAARAGASVGGFPPEALLDRAQTLLREALESYTQIGMPRHVEMTHALLSQAAGE